MLNDRMKFDWMIGLMPYGDGWRARRRLMHEKMHPRAAEVYKPIQAKYTRYEEYLAIPLVTVG